MVKRTESVEAVRERAIGRLDWRSAIENGIFKEEQASVAPGARPPEDRGRGGAALHPDPLRPLPVRPFYQHIR